jgi:hypothetical protein
LESTFKVTLSGDAHTAILELLPDVPQSACLAPIPDDIVPEALDESYALSAGLPSTAFGVRQHPKEYAGRVIRVGREKNFRLELHSCCRSGLHPLNPNVGHSDE